MPLEALGEHIVSQGTQLVLRFPSLHPHQKLWSIALIARHVPLGNLKHDMEKVGIAIATALIKNSFPPIERISSSQP
jgi:hypothetical protein